MTEGRNKGLYFGFNDAGIPVAVSRFDTAAERQDARNFVRKGTRRTRVVYGDDEIRRHIDAMDKGEPVQ